MNEDVQKSSPINRETSSIINFDDQFRLNCDMCCKPPLTPLPSMFTRHQTMKYLRKGSKRPPPPPNQMGFAMKC